MVFWTVIYSLVILLRFGPLQASTYTCVAIIITYNRRENVDLRHELV